MITGYVAGEQSIWVEMRDGPATRRIRFNCEATMPEFEAIFAGYM